MDSDFNPYSEWLKIPEEKQPPNHYALLDLCLFEDGACAIAAAYEVRCNEMHKVSTGRRGELAIQLLDEISDAFACLSHTDAKEKYDKQLGRTATPPPTTDGKPEVLAATAAPGEVVPPPRTEAIVQRMVADTPIDEYRESDSPMAQASRFAVKLVMTMCVLCLFAIVVSALAWYNASDGLSVADASSMGASAKGVDSNETSVVVQDVATTTAIEPANPATVSSTDQATTSISAGVANDDSTNTDFVPADTSDPADTLTTNETTVDAIDESASSDLDFATPAPASVGSFVSKDVVLARWNPDDKGWYRLAQDDELKPDDRLLLLPAYRARLSLDANLSIDVVGPALFEIQSPDDEGFPVIEMEYGKFLISRTGGTRGQLNLGFGDNHASLSLSDADASIAIEVFNYLSPGNDPEKAKSTMIARLNGVTGNAEWQESGQPLVAINVDQQQVYQDTDRKQIPLTDKLPDWISGNPRPVEIAAANVLSSRLSRKQRLSTQLGGEVGFSAEVDVRGLITQSLIYFDQFEPAIRQLNVVESKSFTSPSIAVLRHALARGPATAAQIRKVFETLRGDEGSQLYRMLCGYTQQQLDDGEAENLVRGLQEDSFDFRVLAFENLKQITGATLGYRPEYQSTLLVSKAHLWQRRQRANAIRYAKAPSPLPGVIVTELESPTALAGGPRRPTALTGATKRAQIRTKLIGEWEEDVASMAARYGLPEDRIIGPRNLGFMQQKYDFQSSGSVTWNLSALTRFDIDAGKWDVMMSGSTPVVAITDGSKFTTRMTLEFTDDDSVTLKPLFAARGTVPIKLKRIKK